MKLNSRWIGFAAVIAIALIAVLLIDRRGSDTDDNVVRVGYKQNSGYQNYFIALKQGFFDEHSVTVEGTTFQSTNQMLQALALGHIDATAAGSIEVVAGMALNDPDAIRIYLTLVFHKENAFYSVVVPVDSPLKTLADLQGKKVGTLPGTTSSALFRYVIKEFINPDEVEVLQITPRLQLQTLAAGEVDALYTVDPVVTMAQIRGIGEVMRKGPENDYILNPLANGAGMVSTAFLKNRPEAARRFIDAMNDAIDYMRTNEENTRQIIATETKLDLAVADRMDLIGYWKLEETDFDIVQGYLDFLMNNDIIGSRIDAKSLYMSQD